MEITKFTNTTRKLTRPPYCTAIIVAAGSASRMGGIDKVMAELGGEPMIVRSVRTFQECDAIREIVIVTRQDLVVPIMGLCHGFDKVQTVTVGGSSRQESVRAGLSAMSKKTKLVAVHDGARPLITASLIDTTVRAARAYGAAAPAVAVKDTIKEVRGGVVTATPERRFLQAVQTPQIFDVDLLNAALVKAEEDAAEVTDDCSAVERMGMSVKIVPGDEHNIKITTPTDLKIAEAFLEEEA